jgi:hypothetical protein
MLQIKISDAMWPNQVSPTGQLKEQAERSVTFKDITPNRYER